MAVAQLVVDLKAETAAFRADMGKAAHALNTTTAKMRRSVDKVSSAVSGLRNAFHAVQGAVLAVGALMAGGEVLRLADEYNVLQERIKSATAATGDYQQVASGLSSIAKETGAALSDSVDVFQRLSLGAKDLGKSNEDVLKLVRAVQQLGVISGASNTAMSAGLLQFGQAMSAGVVRAEEFNSIVENLPMLAQKIADGFGVSVGQLRQMVLEGEVLSKDVFNILLSQSDGIQQQFDKMPASLERSVPALKQTMVEFLGTIDKNIGVTSTLAKTVQNLTRFYEDNKDVINPLVGAVGNLVRGLIDLAGSGLNVVMSMTGIKPLFQAVFGEANTGKGIIKTLTDFINGLANAFKWLAEKINIAANAMSNFYRERQKNFQKKLDGFREFIGVSNDGAGNGGVIPALGNVVTDWGTSMPMTQEMLDGMKANIQSVEDVSTDSMTQIANAVREMGSQFTDTFMQMAQTGKFEFKALVTSILNDIARLTLQMAVVEPISKGISSLIGGALGAFSKGFSIPGRASGGPVTGGQPYIVGERGPELMVPKTSGHIVPNHALSGGASPMVVEQHIHVTTGVQNTVRAELIAMMPDIINRTTQGVMEAISRGGKMAQMVGVRA